MDFSLLPNIRAVLFDFDGVIAHTAPIVKQALWKFFTSRQLKIAKDDYENDEYATKSLEQICGILAEKYHVYLDAHELRGQIWEAQVQLMNLGLESDPSLKVFLEYCQKKSIKVAIGSNTSRPRITYILEKMGIEKYFLFNPLFEGEREKKRKEGGNTPPSSDSGTRSEIDSLLPFKKEVGYNIIGATDITHHKPDPEVWLTCAEMLDVPISDCLIIEDGLPGLTGAKSCGAKSVYYRRFCRPEKACEEIAEKSIESFAELIE